jgi:hypothetical protein
MSSSGYVNPIPASANFHDRVDQGVDFLGSGPIKAMGNGTVIEVNTGNTGWGPPNGPAPGLWLTYRLSDGPMAGHVVYVAEGANPTVKPGQKVTAGQVIANMNGSSIETGWANDQGTGALSQTPQAGGIGGGNLPPTGTAVGQDFENLLVSLGVGKATNFGEKPGGKLPAGFDNPIPQGGATPPPGGGGGGGTSLLSLPGDIVKFFTDANTFVTKLMWLANPASWLRIGAFLAGIALLLFAIHALVAAGKGEPLVSMPTVIPVPV